MDRSRAKRLARNIAIGIPLGYGLSVGSMQLRINEATRKLAVLEEYHRGLESDVKSPMSGADWKALEVYSPKAYRELLKHKDMIDSVSPDVSGTAFFSTVSRFKTAPRTKSPEVLGKWLSGQAGSFNAIANKNDLVGKPEDAAYYRFYAGAFQGALERLKKDEGGFMGMWAEMRRQAPRVNKVTSKVRDMLLEAPSERAGRPSPKPAQPRKDERFKEPATPGKGAPPRIEIGRRFSGGARLARSGAMGRGKAMKGAHGRG